MNWTDIITAVVALYGAALATYTLIAQWRESRPRVNVKIEMGFFSNALDYTSDEVAFLLASNSGEKAVTLVSYGFQLPKEQDLIALLHAQTSVPFPCELLPGKSCRVWIQARELARALESQGFSGRVKLIGFYWDQVDRIYRSKPWEFDVDDWAKQT